MTKYKYLISGLILLAIELIGLLGYGAMQLDWSFLTIELASKIFITLVIVTFNVIAFILIVNGLIGEQK